MSNEIVYIYKRFAVKNSGLSSRCLALKFNQCNLTTTILQAKNQFNVAKYDQS